jgi:sodium transport system ATP-binding protein
MIAVDDIAKSFGKRRDVRAVRDVTFEAPDGAITGLLGPNGAGKTTLLRMIATLVIPDAGRASVDGLDVVADRYAVRSRIGVLSDARGLYPRLTARENVRYYGALHGLSGPRLEQRIDTLLATLGLTALADRRTAGFSQGEKMKVAIARALVHDPHTILLDEPTNGLDIMSVRTLRDELRALRAAGKCLLF